MLEIHPKLNYVEDDHCKAMPKRLAKPLRTRRSGWRGSEERWSTTGQHWEEGVESSQHLRPLFEQPSILIFDDDNFIRRQSIWFHQKPRPAAISFIPQTIGKCFIMRINFNWTFTAERSRRPRDEDGQDEPRKTDLGWRRQGLPGRDKANKLYL